MECKMLCVHNITHVHFLLQSNILTAQKAFHIVMNDMFLTNLHAI